MNDMVYLLLIPIAGFAYCVFRRRPIGQYVGWTGVFLIILALNLIHIPGMIPSIMCIVGIGLLVFVCWDPFDWFSLARIDMEYKYPEFYGKNKTSQSSSSSLNSYTTSQSTYSSVPSPSYTPTIYTPATYTPTPKKGPCSELIENTSLRNICSSFFGAVSSFQEVNGSGSVIVRKNGDSKTFYFDAHYCNYEDMDCTNRIGYFLCLPGAFSIGCGDSFNYTLEKVECPESDFGVANIISVLRSTLPNATITGQTSRDDFCSVQFST